MASKDDDFDPNDLDSIDALLDEAEQEVAENKPAEPEESSGEDDFGDLDDFDFDGLSEGLNDPELTDVSVDQLKEQELPDEPELTEPESEREPEAVAVGAAAAAVADSMVDKPTSKPLAEPEEEFVSKRARTSKTPTNKHSAAEMDSIKKLVIIFGSVLIVLALTAIGIGIWSALAASSGLSEETQGMIEDIKAGTETNTLSSLESAKVSSEVEKKLDALSFQLEQLTADIVALESAGKVGDIKVESAGLEAVVGVKPVAEVVPTAPSAPVAPADHGLLEKINVVSSKMNSTQKRIDEVNRRVKDVQAKYSKLMHGIKVVEKQLIEQQAKAVKQVQESEKSVNELDQNRYQYNRVPDGMHYDQANPDSYP